jgi:hypothetical protein
MPVMHTHKPCFINITSLLFSCYTMVSSFHVSSLKCYKHFFPLPFMLHHPNSIIDYIAQSYFCRAETVKPRYFLFVPNILIIALLCAHSMYSPPPPFFRRVTKIHLIFCEQGIRCDVPLWTTTKKEPSI